MWNEPTQEQLKRIIPVRLYDSEFVSLRDKVIYAHLFLGDNDWYLCEYDGEDLFFGFCILGNCGAEWGYVSLNELKNIKVAGWLEVDFDLYFEPKSAKEISKIRRAHRWAIEGECYV